MRLAVLASRVGYEERRILDALDRRGVPYVQVDPRRLAAEIGDPGGPGADLAFDVALNREISLSRALYAGLLLESRGVRTVNDAAVIEVCGDKFRTSLALAAAGLRTPRTALALTPEAALDAADRLGYPVVIKPLAGSWGRLAALARDRAEAATVLEHRAALPSPAQHVIYLQELVGKPDRDIRALVLGDRVVAAAYRYGNGDGWRANAARGGRCAPCPMTPELEKAARTAAEAVGSGILGVDLIEGPDGLYVLEVNHRVEFRCLQSAYDDALDVADAIAGHLIGEP